jgi:tryptophanyl-tRNA synthetase
MPPVLTTSPSPAGSASLRASQRRSQEIEAAIAADPGRCRVLTGDRPTGPLHVGHLFGSLLNRVRLQDLGVSVIVLIADLQAITDRDAPQRLPADVLGLVADYLAAGIDPGRSVIFAHSQVAELNQLLIPFLSLVSVAEVGRNPTVKEEAAAAGSAAMSALMFTYPVHQAADILAFRAGVVPVGQDQLPHLELTRTIARRFNERYSPAEPYFPEPAALLSDTPLLLGLDGTRKMGKSLGNAIPLGATADETARLIRTARTDAQRHISYDPAGRPEVSNLLLLAALCLGTSPQAVAGTLGGGAGALKRLLTDALNERLRSIRGRRAELAADPGYLRRVLADGNERAREVAARTLADVRALMHTAY